MKIDNGAKAPVYFRHDVRVAHLFDGLPFRHLPTAGKEGRALGLSRPPDYVQLSSALTDLLPVVTAHFKRIGLPVASHVVFDDDTIDESLRNSCSAVDVFCPGVENSSDEWLVTMVRNLNDKNYFVMLCQEQGWPVPSTMTYSNQEGFNGRLPPGLVYPVAVKAAVSAGGHEVFVCDNDDDLGAAVSKLSGRRFQVQEYLEGAVFYSLQNLLYGTDDLILKVTKQIMVGPNYAGTSTVVPAEIVSQVFSRYSPVLLSGKHISKQGLCIFGIDFAVTEDNRILLIECNPRYTAAIYPAVVAKRLGCNEWEYRYFQVGQRDLQQLLPPKFEFNQKTRSGWVLVDWGSILRGEVGLLILGNSLAERLALLNAVERHLASK